MLLLLAFYVDNWWGTTATTSIFIAAAVTDWLDGYIARKVWSSYVCSQYLIWWEKPVLAVHL